MHSYPSLYFCLLDEVRDEIGCVATYECASSEFHAVGYWRQRDIREPSGERMRFCVFCLLDEVRDEISHEVTYECASSEQIAIIW